MHPELVRIFGLHVQTYGLLTAVGFLAAFVITLRQARRQGLDPDRLLDLGLFILLAGFLGARLLFVLTDVQFYIETCRGGKAPRTLGEVLYDCTRALHIWEGGLVWYGGFLAALGVGVWVCRRRGLSPLRTADLIMPGVALGHVFGRLGCLAGGCCYGKPTSSALGISFGPASLAYQDLTDALEPLPLATPRLHPTQLYEALGELLIGLGLLALGTRKRFHGHLLLTYLAAYPLLRTIIEIFRGDAARKYIVTLSTPRLNAALGLPESLPSFLSTSQCISLVVAAGAVALYVTLRRRLQGGSLPGEKLPE